MLTINIITILLILMVCLIDLEAHFVYHYDGRLQGYNPVIVTYISLISDCGFSFYADIEGRRRSWSVYTVAWFVPKNKRLAAVLLLIS